MSYSVYDPQGPVFLGDVASIGGWSAFVQWAYGKNSIVDKFIVNGAVSDAQALATALDAMRAPDKDVDSTRQQLAFIAGNAPRAIVLSDGTEDILWH